MKEHQFCFYINGITTKRHTWIIIFYVVVRSVRKPLDTWGEEMREKWPLRLVADIKHCLVGKLNIPQSIIVLY